MLHFNSIKVRLELLNVVIMEKVISFQFHKGTIRTGFKPASSQRLRISIP